MDQTTLTSGEPPALPAKADWANPAVLVFLFWTAAAWPSLVWFILRGTDGSDEPLGIIALAAALWFLMRERPGMALEPRGLPAGGLLLFLSAWPGQPPLFSGLLAILALACAFGLPWRSPGITALLGLSLPWMASLDFYLGAPFRELIALAAAGILRAIGLPVEAVGAVIELAGRPVAVDPPCTGLGMLWHALFAAAALASLHHLTLAATIRLFVCSGLFAIAGNVARTSMLFFPEAGLVDWPSWTHELIGLAWFLSVLLVLVLIAGRSRSRGRSGGGREARSGNDGKMPWCWAAAAAGAVCLAWWPGTMTRPVLPVGKVAWPDHWEGLELVPLEPDDIERRFARGFPGEIRRFHFDGGQLILRRVDRATRMLHASSDCLRAAGCRLLHQPRQTNDESGAMVSRYTMSDSSGALWEVTEWIESEDGEHRAANVSSWYWMALRSPGAGPWLAVTVMRKIG